jgi:hypothetical protein
MRSDLVSVIGFAGPAGVGKSAAAAILAMRGYKVMSFADPLRALAMDLHPEWGWVDLTGPGKDRRPPAAERMMGRGPGLSPRETLRVLGDHLRALSPGLLVETLRARIETARADGLERLIVVDDVRMPAEADLLRGLGSLIHLRRDGVQYRRDHATELPVECHSGELIIRNPGDVLGLTAEIHQAVQILRTRDRARAMQRAAGSALGDAA